MAVWDVAARPAGEQFGYWREVICEAFVPLTPTRRRDTDGFASRVETRPLARVIRARIGSQPQRTTHGAAEVARTDGEFVFVNLQTAGTCAVEQGGGARWCGPVSSPWSTPRRPTSSSSTSRGGWCPTGCRTRCWAGGWRRCAAAPPGAGTPVAPEPWWRR